MLRLTNTLRGCARATRPRAIGFITTTRTASAVPQQNHQIQRLPQRAYSSEAKSDESKDAKSDARSEASSEAKSANDTSDASVLDGLSQGSVKGRTGGGQPLDSSSDYAPAKPKITNQSVPGSGADASLTPEQRREVEEHNRDFDAKHDHGDEAPDDKVHNKFWKGERHGTKRTPV